MIGKIIGIFLCVLRVKLVGFGVGRVPENDEIPVQLFIDGVDYTELYVKCSENNQVCKIDSAVIDFENELRIQDRVNDGGNGR